MEESRISLLKRLIASPSPSGYEKEAGIAFQFDVQGAYTGTDNDEIQITREGVATGLLNIPCRYMHSGSEVVSLKDIDATAELMARFVLSLDKDTSVIP